MKKVFDKVLIVMFENQYRSYVLKDAFMQKIKAAGCDMTNFFGCFHPSQTNYLSSLSGEICGVTNDTPPIAPLLQETLVDLMEPSNAPIKTSWKAYMEAYPNEAWKKIWENPNYPAAEQPIPEYPNDGVNLARYFRKHNAFASYHSIQANESKWNKIVDDIQFWKDVTNKELPEYSWFTPDIWNDGHYVYNTHTSTNPRYPLVGQMSNWLEYVFFGDIDTSKVQGGTNFGQDKIGLNLDFDLVLTDPKKAYAQSNIPEGTLVVVTFDEADYDAQGYDTNYDGQNQIYTVLLGDMITPGTEVATPYNHFSLIKTIEKNFGLGSLEKNDKDANWLRFLWGETFRWSTPTECNLQASKAIACCEYQNQFVSLYGASDGSLLFSHFDGLQWSPGTNAGLQSTGPIAMAADQNGLFVAYKDAQSMLQLASYTNGAWTNLQQLSWNPTGAVAMNRYYDYSDQREKLMVVWQDAESQQIFSVIGDQGHWQQEATNVGQYTDGPIAVASLGTAVYIIYKERNTFQIRMTSMNTAPFNAVKAQNFKDEPDPANDTSIHTWSPMDFLVGHFSKKQNQHQNDYLGNGQFALASIEGEMHMSYRSRYEDTPQLCETIFGLTGIMTATSQETNGFGTLNQAGWTREIKDNSILLDVDSVNIMASNGDSIMHIYQTKDTDQLQYRIGRYES